VRHFPKPLARQEGTDIAAPQEAAYAESVRAALARARFESNIEDGRRLHESPGMEWFLLGVMDANPPITPRRHSDGERRSVRGLESSRPPCSSTPIAPKRRPSSVSRE
jgi:hypothetical protein